MNVNLTPELERLVKEKVKSGMYGSASEVVREALRRMLQSEQPGTVSEANASYLAGPGRSMKETIAWIRARQKARGHVPPTKEEVDRRIREERDSWDR